MNKLEILLNILVKYEKNSDNEKILNYYQKMIMLLNEFSNFTISNKNFEELSTEVKSIALMNLIKKFNIEVSKKIDKSVKDTKGTLFINLLKGNFPTKKHLLTKNLDEFEESLNPVESSIFNNIRSFVSYTTLSIETFLHFNEFEAENITNFTNRLHDTIIDMIFNDIEKDMLSENLKQVTVIYLTLYGSIYQN